MVNQLHAVSMIDVVIGEQLFGMPDSFGDERKDLNDIQTITSIESREDAFSVIQESLVQIKRKDTELKSFITSIRKMHHPSHTYQPYSQKRPTP